MIQWEVWLTVDVEEVMLIDVVAEVADAEIGIMNV